MVRNFFELFNNYKQPAMGEQSTHLIILLFWLREVRNYISCGCTFDHVTCYDVEESKRFTSSMS